MLGSNISVNSFHTLVSSINILLHISIDQFCYRWFTQICSPPELNHSAILLHLPLLHLQQLQTYVCRLLMDFASSDLSFIVRDVSYQAILLAILSLW